MHNELSVHEIKGVRFGFKWIGDHLLDGFSIQFGKIVNVFHGVFAFWDAKTKVEIKRLQQFVAEKVPLNHTEFLNGLRPNTKVYGSSHFFQPRK